LHVYEEEGGVVVRGTLPVEVDGGGVAERFHLEVVFPTDYPKGVPVVKEPRGRIPRCDDRHMGPDGSACLFVPEEYKLRHPQGQRFVDFLAGPVRDYFLSQLYFERTGRWPFGQRPHRQPGRLEFYRELLGLKEDRLVQPYLQ